MSGRWATTACAAVARRTSRGTPYPSAWGLRPFGPVKVGFADDDVEWVPHQPTPYDEAVAPVVPAAALSLSGLLAVFALLHVALLPANALTLAPVAAVTALVVLGVGLWLRRHPQPASSQAVLAGLFLAVVLNCLAPVAASGRPTSTTYAALAVVGAGACLLGLPWFLATVGVTWLVWVGLLVTVGPPLGDSPVGVGEWVNHGVALAAATGLAAVVRRVHVRSTDIVELARSEAHAAAVRDGLTGVSNRRGLALLGQQILETARRQGDAVHCLFVDVDGLKTVNDQLGHHAGDEVLLAVSDALRGSTRGTDVVARWGSDEFVIIGPGAGTSALEMERRVRSRLIEVPVAPLDVWPARVSAGAAVLEPWDDGTLEELLGRADQEMYLRRSLRREATAPPYRPSVVSPSHRPPTARGPHGSAATG